MLALVSTVPGGFEPGAIATVITTLHIVGWLDLEDLYPILPECAAATTPPPIGSKSTTPAGQDTKVSQEAVEALSLIHI